jgi:phage terminase small subunit
MHVMKSINDTKELNERQKCFCREYVVDFNGYKSAIKAGYSKRTSMEQASRLLRNVKVQKEIARLNKNVEERTDIKVDDVLKSLKLIAFSNITDFITVKNGKIRIKDISKLPPNTPTVIESIHQSKSSGIRIKLYNKLTALELLGKHLGLFTEKHQIHNTGNITSVVELVKHAVQISKKD